MEIQMSSAERALFQAMLGACRTYLEFGSGGSTVAALKCISGDAYTLDSSRDWLTAVADAVAHDHRLKLFHAEIGPTGEWGFPTSEASPDGFPAYSQSIWPFLDLRTLDLVLIDGRFRVACFAEAAARLRPDALIAIHDYRSRPYYHAVEAVSRRIVEVEDLAVFVPMPDKVEEARALADAFRLDAR